MASNIVPIPDITKIPCTDFMAFQDILRRMRTVDDRIIYELNMTIPTNSFATGVDFTKQCVSLHESLSESYDGRENAIRKCLLVTQQKVTELKKEEEKHQDNFEIMKRLRSAQNTLRLLQSEIAIDEIVKDRSIKVLYERCRNALNS